MALIRILEGGQALSAEASCEHRARFFAVLVLAAVTPKATGITFVPSVVCGDWVAVQPIRVERAHAPLQELVVLQLCRFPTNEDTHIFLEGHGSTGSEKEVISVAQLPKMILVGLALEESAFLQASLKTLTVRQYHLLVSAWTTQVRRSPEGSWIGKAGSDSSEFDSSFSEDKCAPRRRNALPLVRVSAQGVLVMLIGMEYKGSSMTGEARHSGRLGPTGGMPTAVLGLQATLVSQNSNQRL